MKVAVVIGHAPVAKGFCSPFEGLPCEWDFNLKVANELVVIAPDVYVIFTHKNYAGGYTAMQRRMANQINPGNFDLAAELHYNAYNGKVGGTEVLYFKGSAKGEKFAKSVCNTIVSDFETANRGAKPLSSGNGYGFLKLMKPPAILIEPFFSDTKSDAEKFIGKEKEYAQTIHNGIMRTKLTTI